MNDLVRGACDGKKLVCLVIDEAHKAMGEFAYVQGMAGSPCASMDTSAPFALVVLYVQHAVGFHGHRLTRAPPFASFFFLNVQGVVWASMGTDWHEHVVCVFCVVRSRRDLGFHGHRLAQARHACVVLLHTK